METEQKSEGQIEEIRIKRDAKGRLLPNSGLISPGRPKGKTIKERVREWLEDNPDDMKAFVDHFVKNNKELAWQMLEGRPAQDLTSAGEKLPTPLLYVLHNDGNKEDKSASEKN